MLTVRERARFEKQATWMLDLSPAVALEVHATVAFQLFRKVTEWEWSGLGTFVRSGECVVGSRGNLDVTNSD